MNEDWNAEAEADLAGRLTDDLGAFAVGSAPIAPVMGWGKAMKTRRRAAQAGVLSAVAVAGVVLPFALRSRPVEPPPPWTNHPATAPHKVTVDPEHTAANGSPVWSGSIDGVRWSVQAGVEGPSMICLTDAFPCAIPDLNNYLGAPASIEGSSIGRDVDGYLVGMDPAVTGVDVYLDDGTDLRLHPTQYAGHHLAVLRLPHGYPIDHIVAHLPAGDQTAVVLNLPGGASTWGVWHPAAAVPDVPTGSGVVASRAGHGKTTRGATVTAYVGPFGVLIDEGTFEYGPSESHPFDGLDLRSALDSIRTFHHSAWAATEVSDAVDHVVLEFPDGTRQVVTPVVIGGLHFVASYLQADRPPVRAVSYNAAGGVLTVSDANHGPGAAATSSASTTLR